MDIIEKISLQDCNILIEALDMKMRNSQNQKMKKRCQELRGLFLHAMNSKTMDRFEKKFIQDYTGNIGE